MGGVWAICPSYKTVETNVHLELSYSFLPYLLSKLELEDSEMVQKLMQMGG